MAKPVVLGLKIVELGEQDVLDRGQVQSVSAWLFDQVGPVADQEPKNVAFRGARLSTPRWLPRQ